MAKGDNQRAMLALIRSISGQDNVLTIPRVYVSLTGSHRSALLLSQCVYWSDRSRDPDGWFYKTYVDWQAELGIPRGGIDTALMALSDWIETRVKKVGGTPKKHYRVRMEILAASVLEMLERQDSDLSESDKSEMSESDKSSLTETTSSETTTDSAPASPAGAVAKPEPRGAGTKAIQKAYETLLGYTVDDWSAGEAKAAKLIGAKYTVAELDAAYRYYKATPFWKDKRLALRSLKTQIPEYLKMRGKLPATNGNGARYTDANGIERPVLSNDERQLFADIEAGKIPDASQLFSN